MRHYQSPFAWKLPDRGLVGFDGLVEILVIVVVVIRSWVPNEPWLFKSGATQGA